MVEISKSGSGEGLGGVIPRGYSRIVTGPHEANRQDPRLPMQYDTGRPSSIEVTATTLDNDQ